MLNTILRASTALTFAFLVSCGSTTTSDRDSKPDAADDPDVEVVADAVPIVDAAPADTADPPQDTAIDDLGEPDAGPAPCGDEALPTGSISGTEGLAIAADGTAYYSQSAAIGRRAPGESAEGFWLSLPGAATVWGLALRDDGMLFAGSPTTNTIYKIDTNAETPTAGVATSSAGSPNGVIVGPDDAVYYSDFGGGHVYRLADDATPTKVSASLFSQPNGLLFDPDGALLVLEYSKATVWRLTLDASMAETERAQVTSLTGAALDGIARDDQGRYYLTDNANGRLLRFDDAFGNEETLLTGVPAAANLAFGRGALRCQDVYVTSAGTLAVYELKTQ